MKLIVNGEAHAHNGHGTVAELLREFQAEPARIALMVNGDVVRRDRWESVRLSEGDQVELLMFAAGG
jgi:sulfur carrier protein